MAVTLNGNIIIITPLLDLATSPPSRPRITLSSDLFIKDFHLAFESVFDPKDRHLSNTKNKFNNKSKLNGVEYDNSSDDESNGLDDDLDDDDGVNWEVEMRKRVKEIEEMKELEKKAEELQYRVDDEFDDDSGGGNDEETEDEKRMRVKRELEKVENFDVRVIWSSGL